MAGIAGRIDRPRDRTLPLVVAAGPARRRHRRAQTAPETATGMQRRPRCGTRSKRCNRMPPGSRLRCGTTSHAFTRRQRFGGRGGASGTHRPAVRARFPQYRAAHPSPGRYRGQPAARQKAPTRAWPVKRTAGQFTVEESDGARGAHCGGELRPLHIVCRRRDVDRHRSRRRALCALLSPAPAGLRGSRLPREILQRPRRRSDRSPVGNAGAGRADPGCPATSSTRRSTSSVRGFCTSSRTHDSNRPPPAEGPAAHGSRERVSAQAEHSRSCGHGWRRNHRRPRRVAPGRRPAESEPARNLRRCPSSRILTGGRPHAAVSPVRIRLVESLADGRIVVQPPADASRLLAEGTGHAADQFAASISSPASAVQTASQRSHADSTTTRRSPTSARQRRIHAESVSLASARA